MIVPKKPFWMRRATYLHHLVDTFFDQAPEIVLQRYSPVIPLCKIALAFKLTRAYPDRNKLQEVIDEYSEVILDAQRSIEEKEATA